MRYLLALIALALVVPASAAASNRPDARLDAAVTEVAGQPVTVWCETHWSSWILTGVDAFGEDWSFLFGFTFIGRPVVYVNPAICETLHALLARESVGTYHAALALQTLAHEGVHQRGVTDEGEAECTALPLVRGLAVNHFGVPATVVESYTATVRRRVVVRVKGRRVVRYVSTQVVRSRQVENPWLARVGEDALRWHRALPPEYQGNC